MSIGKRWWCAAAILAISAMASPAQTGTVRIGVLHSLTGTMAISETSLKDAVLMAVDEINGKGGVLGRRIEPVVVDPASDWPLFTERARQLLSTGEVSAVFGCWTSVSRKSVLPVFESMNGLLFYPVPYEGEEQSPNIVYTGAVTNQQVIPAAEYLMSREGGSKTKFYLLGTDYVYPRTVNKVLKTFLLSKGVPEQNIVEEYTPFGHSNYQDIVQKIRAFGRGGDAAVMSTIVLDSNVAFYREFANQGVLASQIPIMAFSIAEDELRTFGGNNISAMVGHLAAWNYFQSIDTPENRAFVEAFKRRYGANRVTDDPIEAAYSGVYAWKAAVEKAQSFEVNRVRGALADLRFSAPSGPKRIMENQHTAKPFYIGQIRADGQFNIVYKSSSPIEPESFSRYLNQPGLRSNTPFLPRTPTNPNRPADAFTPNENAAIMNLRTINVAEVTYLSITGGSFGDLPAMIRRELLDPRFAGSVSGYNYVVAVIGNSGDYISTALPASPSSGRYGFFSSPDGVVRYLLDPEGRAGGPVQ